MIVSVPAISKVLLSVVMLPAMACLLELSEQIQPYTLCYVSTLLLIPKRGGAGAGGREAVIDSFRGMHVVWLLARERQSCSYPISPTAEQNAAHALCWHTPALFVRSSHWTSHVSLSVYRSKQREILEWNTVPRHNVIMICLCVSVFVCAFVCMTVRLTWCLGRPDYSRLLTLWNRGPRIVTCLWQCDTHAK